MQRIIYLPGAVNVGFHGQLPGLSDTSRGTSQPTLFPDVKICLLTGKVACSSQSQQCYGHVSVGTGSSVAFFHHPRLSVFPKFVLICLGGFLPFSGGQIFFLSIFPLFFSAVW